MRGKTDKCMVVLDMYEALLSGEGIDKKEYIEKYNISIPTFCRYILVVRRFFAERKGEKLVYRRIYNRYYLED